MFEPAIDAWYVWVGVTLASAGALGIAASLPTAPPPDATGAARVVDGVAGSPYAATGEHPLSVADELRLSPTSIGLRGPGGSAHAPLRDGPVTPVRREGDLARVLDGAPPSAVFDGPDAFESAANRTLVRSSPPDWRPAPDQIRARHVTWGGVDVTLVG